MFNQANLSITIQVFTLLGIAWAIYASLRKPQEKSETNDAVYAEKFVALEKTVINLRDNHLHTLEVKIDETNKRVSGVELQMTKIATIMDERLPSKSNS
jgi:hypothetical protein